MSVREQTFYIVACDWPACRRTSYDLAFDDWARESREEALEAWVDSDAVDASNGNQYCDEHASKVCVTCGITSRLTEGKDRWFRCPEHHAKDGDLA